MKREVFKNLMNALIDQIKYEDEITEKLESFIDGNFILTISENLCSTIVTELSREFNDETDIISWWLFDAPEAGKNKECCNIYYDDIDGEKNISVKNLDELYDYLVTLKV